MWDERLWEVHSMRLCALVFVDGGGAALTLSFSRLQHSVPARPQGILRNDV